MAPAAIKTDYIVLHSRQYLVTANKALSLRRSQVLSQQNEGDGADKGVPNDGPKQQDHPGPDSGQHQNQTTPDDCEINPCFLDMAEDVF